MSTTWFSRAVAPQAAPPASQLPRLLPAGAVGAGLHAHLRRFGEPPRRSADGLIAMVEESGLTGRGGAAFPTYRKLRAVREARGRAVVVANGAEGEPASAKDRVLLTMTPHLVLDGLQLAAEAVGARRAYIYVHDDPTLTDEVRDALDERRVAGIDRVAVEQVTAPPRFLSGQETAVVSRVSGGAALPRSTPPPVFQRGVRGRPTLVQNVETLAHIALIARYGAAWFRSLGTAKEPGSMLFTVGGAVRRPGVVEAAIGTRLADVLTAAGGPTAPLTAVLIGGFHGAWLPADTALEQPLTNAALRSAGAALGAGIVVALPADACGLKEAARAVAYLAGESARQCGPCMKGLPLIAAALTELAGPYPRGATLTDLKRWTGLVENRGACRHPDGTARLVRSTLRVFASEIERHRRGGCSGTARVLPVPGFHLR